MHPFYKGLTIGAASAMIALCGYSLGMSQTPTAALVEADPVSLAALSATVNDRLTQSDCEVRVGLGRVTAGSQCLFDQVMVGMRDNYLLCANIEVNCPVE